MNKGDEVAIKAYVDLIFRDADRLCADGEYETASKILLANGLTAKEVNNYIRSKVFGTTPTMCKHCGKFGKDKVEFLIDVFAQLNGPLGKPSKGHHLFKVRDRLDNGAIIVSPGYYDWTPRAISYNPKTGEISVAT